MIMITGAIRKGCCLAHRACAQEAMRAAEATSTEECPVKIKLVAPPLYVLTTNVRSLAHATTLPLNRHYFSIASGAFTWLD